MNHRTFILFVSMMLLTLVLYQKAQGQQDVRIKRRQFKIDHKEGFSSAWKHRRKGDRAYDKGYGHYQVALSHFKKAHDYNPQNAALNYKMGVCYFKQNQLNQAIKFFNRALSQDEQVAIDVYYLLGRAYHLNYAFDQAIENYQRCLEPDILEELEHKRKTINAYVRQCSNGQKLVKNPVRVNINNLGPAVNSKYPDYGPVFVRGGELMYFTSRRKHEDNDERWLGDNRFYSDIYRAVQVDGAWKNTHLIDEEIFSPHNDAVVEATQDPLRIYVYRGQKDEGDIYYYEKDGDRWRGPKNFSRMINTNAKESAMCFSKDGNTLYFVSTFEARSFGKKDIFMSRRDEDGDWGRPINLGGMVNSSLNEEGVFVNSTGDKLYFSSEGHNSMGGYDLFVAERDVDGNWQEPKNLGYPINTPFDDLLFRKVEGTANKAYYSSVHDENVGAKDIYEIIFLGEKRDLHYTPIREPLAWKARPQKEMLYQVPQKLAIDTTLYVTGKIIDSLAREGIQAKIQVIDNQKNKVIATHLSDTNGHYMLQLPEQKKYGIEITAQGYLFYAHDLDLNQAPVKNDTLRRNFSLDKVEVGTKMVLENIYFETNSSKLKPSSYPELKRVVKLMQSNPGMKLEISGHTDDVGSYLANKKLSRARAKSVVEYLAEQGVDRARLTYKGYSFTQPIATNDTPEGRQKNRRVEFKVLEK